MKYALLLVAGIVIVLRFVLPSHGLNSDDIYKDIAHLFVGGLFATAIYLSVACICLNAKMGRMRMLAAEQVNKSLSSSAIRAVEEILDLMESHLADMRSDRAWAWSLASVMAAAELSAFALSHGGGS